MVPIALIVGVVIVAGTAVITASRYGDLPDRIPIHFSLNGTVNSYGPRQTAWLIVVVQFAMLAIFALTYEAGVARGTLVLGVGALAIAAAAQMLILSAATSGKTRVNMTGFWVFFVAVIALGTLVRGF